MKKILYCLFILLSIENAFSLSPSRQLTQFIHDTWSVQEGLPPGMITSLCQSNNGYLWIGSFGGLVRYDGVTFRVYDRSESLLKSSDKIFATAATKDGGIYFATTSGLFHYKNGIIHSVQMKNIRSQEQINKLYSDKKGNLWIGTSWGLLLKENSQLKRIHNAQQMPRGFRYSLSESTDGTMYIGTPEGVYTYRNGFISTFSTQNFQGLVTAITVDKQNTVWIGTNSGLGRVSKSSELVITSADGLVGDVVQTLFTDSDGNVWIGTNQGLSRASSTGIISSAPATMFPADAILSIFEDIEKNLWIGTFSNGLHRLRDGTFTTLSTKEGLSDDFTRSIIQTSDGSLWIGASNGLNQYKNGSISFFSFKDGLIGNEVNALCEDKSGNLWIGGAPGYLTRYRNGIFTGVPISPETSPDPVYSIFEDNKGVLWIGSDNGVLLYSNGNITRLGEKQGLLRGLYTNISQDDKGNIWLIAYGGGVIRYTNGKIKTFTNKNGLPTPHIKSIYHNGSGEILLGTDGKGLLRLKNDGSIQSITKSAGLPHEDIYHIESDGLKKLWFSTGKGIFSCTESDIDNVFSGKSTKLSAITYGTRDGMIAIECNSGFFPAGWRTHDGTLCFPTVKGIAFVNPQKGVKNKLAPNVLVENISVNDSIYENNGTPFSFAAGSDRISITFTALSLIAPEKVRFKYMLEGMDETWIDYGNKRTAYFTNLSPGKYTFKVIACNNDGVWNNTGSSVSFEIAPELWQTIWFRVIMVAALLAFLYFLYVLRVRALQKRQQELEKIVEERTNDLWSVNQSLQDANKQLEKNIAEIEALNTNLIELNNEKNEFLGIAAHDLKNPLSGIMLTASNVKNFIKALKTEDIVSMMEKMEISAQRMREIITHLLDINALESGIISHRLEAFDLKTVVDTICSENITNATEKNITINNNSVSASVFADKSATQEIIDNLLSNAIKFSPFNKNVTIDISKHNNAIRCSVKDEGPGLSAEDMKKVFGKYARLSAKPTGGEHSTGLGLSIVKKLAESMNGNVGCESVLGQGACFYVELPIKK